MDDRKDNCLNVPQQAPIWLGQSNSGRDRWRVNCIFRAGLEHGLQKTSSNVVAVSDRSADTPRVVVDVMPVLDRVPGTGSARRVQVLGRPERKYSNGRGNPCRNHGLYVSIVQHKNGV